jgi:hypothetical protein
MGSASIQARSGRVRLEIFDPALGITAVEADA